MIIWLFDNSSTILYLYALQGYFKPSHGGQLEDIVIGIEYHKSREGFKTKKNAYQGV